MRLKFILLFSLLSVVCGNAANVYVRDGGSGAGTSWSDALDDLPGTLTRGNTYYVADGSYAAYTFDDAVSGATLITIKKATTADHGTETGWSAGYGDGVAQFGNLTFNTSYYTLDGQVGGGPGSWDTGHGFKISFSGYNIVLAVNVSYITIRHMEIQGGGRYSGDNQDNIYAVSGGNTDLTISYCYLHDVGVCHLLTRGTTRTTVEYSKIARNGPVSDGLHREAWSFSSDNDAVVRYCIFEDISNTAVLAGVNGVGTVNNWKVYGNVFYRTGALTDVSVAAIVMVKYESPTFLSANNWTFVNNVIVNATVNGNAGLALQNGTNNIAANNIWYLNTANTIWLQNCSASYNWYAQNWRTDGCVPPCNVNNVGESNVQIGTASPFVNWQTGDFALTSGTTAGMTLSSPYNVDMLGVTRAVDGVWDRGALEFNSGGVPSPPTAPSGLNATAISISQINLGWTDNSADETGFKIDRAPLQTAPFVDLATVGAGVVTYSDTGLTASSTYYYRVRAYKTSGGDSAVSNTANATTQQSQSPPNTNSSAGGVGGVMIGVRRQ